jgi:hypothetical protein
VIDRYQPLRSVSDKHVFVVCHGGGFYDSRITCATAGPGRPSIAASSRILSTSYLFDIEKQGYSPVRFDLAVFKQRPGSLADNSQTA